MSIYTTAKAVTTNQPARQIRRARKLNLANATVVLRRPEFRGTNAWRRRGAQNQILSEFPSGLNQTGGKFCLILGVGVSLLGVN